jgi:cell shape-determining protein MreC
MRTLAIAGLVVVGAANVAAAGTYVYSTYVASKKIKQQIQKIEDRIIANEDAEREFQQKERAEKLALQRKMDELKKENQTLKKKLNKKGNR